MGLPLEQLELNFTHSVGIQVAGYFEQLNSAFLNFHQQLGEVVF